jgi:hypothetical protein
MPDQRLCCIVAGLGSFGPGSGGSHAAMLASTTANCQLPPPSLPTTSLVQVGKRKRSVRWDDALRAERASEGRDYYLVPPERALVPVSLAAAAASPGVGVGEGSGGAARHE